jgi:demethylmenaquinone methyltransferase/2-methoxy-6-polyprenyl-1,4-benzoquinol methylase
MENRNLPKDKKSNEIRKMFSSIAPSYDFLNHFLSFHFDKMWRKKAAKRFSPKADEIYLDLCCGTGDFSVQLSKRGETKIIGLDFSLEMLKIARGKTDKIYFINGDAMAMPFKDETFDGCIVAFGIRNFENLEKGICEAERVLKKGAPFVILEFPNKVKGVFSPVFKLYFKFILPIIGRIISKNDFAYKYLPESTKFFPSKDELKEIFQKCGFEVVEIKERTFGIVNEIVLQKSKMQR